MVHSIGKQVPDAGKAAFIAWNAEVAGSVELGEESSVWFGASVRADVASISIGKGSNIQDNVTVHVDSGKPTRIGDYVTVGHNAVVHGCTVHDGCLVGIGAVILSGAEIGEESIVGAGALVTEGKSFPPRSLIIGSPARSVRTVTDEELVKMRRNAEGYIAHAHEAVEAYRELEE